MRTSGMIRAIGVVPVDCCLVWEEGGRALTVGSAPASCFPFLFFAPSVTVSSAERALAVKQGKDPVIFQEKKKKGSIFL